MGRITSSIGLATGFPIQETVDQLIALQSRRRDLLVNQNKKIDGQRTAVTGLTAQMVAIQIQIRRLASPTVFQQRTVTSSHTELLDAVASGTPQLGNYQFTPLRAAQAQQLQSSRFASSDQPLGGGAFSFRFGGFIDTGVGLDLLGEGAGFSRGKIRITDRSGTAAEIDLSLARNIDEVLDAINSNQSLGVRATVHNDSIRLIDETGAALSNLKVEEVGGTTAASLGLGGINVAADRVDGQDVVNLFEDLTLSHLNDGNGVRFDGFAGDLRITVRDGSRLDIDFNKLTTAATFAQATTESVNGVNASITFKAANAGPDFDGVDILFVDDNAVTAGQETVEYDAEEKRLIFHIEEGATTADQVIAALARDAAASDDFTAARAQGGDGSGFVARTDGTKTTAPKATAKTPGGPHAALIFEAIEPGNDYDNVAIRFVDDPAITKGNETVAYNDTDPLNRELTFHIATGSTTANDIIAALEDDPTASQVFTAKNAIDNNGSGLVTSADTAFTSGGALIAESSKTEDISIGQVLEVINAAAPDKLRASLGANNNLVLTDLSIDKGVVFKVEQLNGSHSAEDLGLDGAVSVDTITGRRLLAGLKTSLAASLNGGKGFGALGEVGLIDRSGATATADLTAAATVDDILEAINTAGVRIAAELNAARNGIILRDTTGSTAGNLIVDNADATNTADKLGLTINAAENSTSSGSLRRQVLNEATTLSSLNGGAGVTFGTVKITDNAGTTKTLTIDSSHRTIGDVLEEIGQLDLLVEARINDAGDGILLIGKATTGTSLKVEEGNSTTARDLGLLGAATTKTVDGAEKQVIEGSTTHRIELSDTDTLQDLVSRINEVTTRVRASVFHDGSTVKPFRFTLFNQSSGKAGELLWDTSAVNFTLAESVKAQDALLQIGPAGAGGVIASSSNNTFAGVLPDITLTVKGASAEPVTISVAPTDVNLVKAVKDFVDAYNKVRDKIKELTRFDETTQTAAVLQGDGRVLRAENDLNQLVSGRIVGAGVFQSLEAVGISLEANGQLRLDEAKLSERFAADPANVTEFFSADETGLSDRFDSLIEQLTGIGDTVLVGRVTVLTRKIEVNQQRIDVWNVRLENQRERLLKSFQHSETVIAKLQSSLAALSAIAPIPIFQPSQ
ncbi:MAG: flagellar filament capping protein FliD [Pirellulales bacterium]